MEKQNLGKKIEMNFGENQIPQGLSLMNILARTQDYSNTSQEISRG